ncbi:hypothetical protein OUZ56_016254 [Daphnia magna]|uniref:Uncharacterized protein n=1 Tax=Daphnia magna TaxID=35525 RepID=A0ABR0AQ47_9CRUS|nr:hypothetical protein OUZ56_016254 [Daphnia magna]
MDQHPASDNGNVSNKLDQEFLIVRFQDAIFSFLMSSKVAHRAVTDSCNRSVSHTCETDPYQACYISVLQEICLELLCFTGFGMLQACVFYVKHTSVIICYGFVAQCNTMQPDDILHKSVLG